MKKVISEGESIPKWYGLAYWRYITRTGVCYPIGLNIIVRICRTVWWAIKRGLIPSWYEEQMEKVRQDSWRAGYEFGSRVKTSVTEQLLQRIMETQKGGE